MSSPALAEADTTISEGGSNLWKAVVPRCPEYGQGCTADQDLVPTTDAHSRGWGDHTASNLCLRCWQHNRAPAASPSPPVCCHHHCPLHRLAKPLHADGPIVGRRLHLSPTAPLRSPPSLLETSKLSPAAAESPFYRPLH